MKIGQKIKVIYDARPMMPIREMEGTLINITPSGLLRVKAPYKDKNGLDGEYNELFYPETGIARGWNTLRLDLDSIYKY